jgi:NAD+ kinase
MRNAIGTRALVRQIPQTAPRKKHEGGIAGIGGGGALLVFQACAVHTLRVIKQTGCTEMDKIAFLASDAPVAQEALRALSAAYRNTPPAQAQAIVALGGDGFMLTTLHATQHLGKPVYGMNCGTIGFLMNEYAEHGLPARLDAAEEEVINPLRMRAITSVGTVTDALAINEVSLLRAGPQAAKLRISVDGKVRMSELVCDGALVSTPAGSTAYNYSAHGPILPIGAEVLALTAMAAFRPRRWRGALLPKTAEVRFDVLQAEKRPVNAVADSTSVENVVTVLIRSEPAVAHRILFDPGHGLEERLTREQFE